MYVFTFVYSIQTYAVLPQRLDLKPYYENEDNI